MKTQEIPREEWAPFFDNFTRRNEGWLVTLEILGAEIGAQVEQRKLAFRGVADESNKIAGDQIMMTFGTKPDNHLTHSIGNVIQVNLEQTDEGADAALQIRSADGTTALLRFRSPMLPEFVDGVVPEVAARPGGPS